MTGVFAGCDEATSIQMATLAPAVTTAPTIVNPYAHSSLAHGHRSGLRQLLPNDSLSRRRKSSVTGFGSTAFHNSHNIQTTTATSVKPNSAMNAEFNMPPR